MSEIGGGKGGYESPFDAVWESDIRRSKNEGIYVSDILGVKRLEVKHWRVKD